MTAPSAEPVSPERLEAAFRMGIGGWGDRGDIVLDREHCGNGPFGLRIRWQDNPKTDRAHFWHMGFPVRRGGIERVSGAVFLLSRDRANMVMYFGDAGQRRWIVPLSFGALPLNEWTRFDVPIAELKPWGKNQGSPRPQTFGSFTIEPSGKGGATEFVLADLAVSVGGTERPLLDARQFPRSYDPPAGVEPVPPADTDETGRAFVAFGASYLANPEKNGWVIEELVARWPLLGISASADPGHKALADIAARCRAVGVPLIGEDSENGHFGPELSLAGAWATRWDGAGNNKTPGAFGWRHAGDTCHPRFLELNKRRADYLIQAGVTRMMFVDYVWPYWGGRWGYGPAAVAAYRAALQERDGGILLRLSDGEKRFSFWDYFGLYADGPWSPATVGLASWDEYVPATERQAWSADLNARRNLFLLVTLQHYRWLKFLDDIGGYYAARGGKLWIIPNPEDLANASDYVVLGKMAHVRGNMPEWFGNPRWTDALYRSGPYLGSAYHDAGNLIGPVLETNAGGHGTPYHDPEVAFVGAYDIFAAITADVMKNDFMDESPLAHMRNPANAGQHDRFRDTMMKLDAFHRFREDKSRRAPCRVAVVGQRCINRYRRSIFFNFGATPKSNDANLAHILAAEGAAFDYLDAIPFAPLEDHDVIFWGAEEAPEHQFQRIAAWLRAAPGRTLICKANQPARRTDGLLYNPWDLPQTGVPHPDGGAAWGLPRIARRPLAGVSAGKPDAWFADAFARDEQIPLPPSGHYACSGGQVLLGTAEAPLVSRFRLANGSAVIYLHYRAGNAESLDVDTRLVRCLMKALHVPAVVPMTDPDTMVHRYELPRGGAVFALWHRPTLNAWKFIYDGNRKQRLPYRSEPARLRLNVALDHPATLIDVLSGKRFSAAPGAATFELKGTTCALVYLVPAGAAIPPTLDQRPPVAAALNQR